MTFYIRPRQDLSLSTFARIIMVLEAEFRPYRIHCTIDSKTGKGVTRIYLPYDDEVPALGAIKSIVKWTDCLQKNFTLIRVKEGDYDPFKKEGEISTYFDEEGVE